MTKNQNITLGQRGHDGKLSMAFIGTVSRAYAKLSVQLHQAACLSFYRVAQYGDPDALNAFYNGLRVNDQTALRVWVGSHATFVDLTDSKVKPWLKWSKDKGFSVVKGTEPHRKDMFTIDSEEDGKTMLLMLKPFYDKDVKEKDALTLEDLINMLKSASEKVSKKSKDENVPLPNDIVNLLKSIDNATTKELEALERVNKE